LGSAFAAAATSSVGIKINHKRSVDLCLCFAGTLGFVGDLECLVFNGHLFFSGDWGWGWCGGDFWGWCGGDFWGWCGGDFWGWGWGWSRWCVGNFHIL
jgi:hypothetical protein